MKKFLTTVLTMLAVVIGASAQYVNISPIPGLIDLSINESGLMSITFSVEENWEPNRNENLFANLYQNDIIIAKVPVSNTRLITFDSIMEFNWTIAFYRTRNPLVLQPGEYRVELEKGLFKNTETGELSEEVILNYTIAEGNNIDINPKPGKILSFQDVEFTFNDYVSIRESEEEVEGDGITIFNLYGSETATGEMMYYRPYVDIDGNKLTLYNTELINTPGTWIVSIPAKTFILVKEDGTEVESPEIDERFIIPSLLGNEYPTPDPAPGNIPYFPGEIILNLPQGQEVKMVNSMAGCYIYPVDEEGNRGQWIARYQASKSKTDSSAVILTNLNKKDGKGLDFNPGAGKYVLVTGNSLYTIVGSSLWQSELEFEYTIENLFSDVIITPDPSEKHKEISEISFTFPNAQSITLQAGNLAWFSSSIASYLFYPQKVEADSKTITYKCAVPVEVPGNYTLQVPSLDWLIDGEYVSLSPEFTIDPSDSIVNPILPDFFNIYSIDGRIVKINANTLEGLDPGLYIVNGKKVLVK